MLEPAATPTWADTSALMRGSCWTLEMKVLVRPISTMAPMSATPSDEPSCWPVYWSPPASLRPDSSTEDWTTLPSWEIIRPIPTPSTAMPMANPALDRVGLIVAAG